MTYLNLDNLKEMVAGDDEIILSLMQSFVQKTPAAMEKLKFKADEEDWEAVAAVAHKMLSSTTIFNMDELSTLLKNIEHDARAKIELEILPGKIRQAEEMLKKSMTALEEEKEKLKN